MSKNKKGLKSNHQKQKPKKKAKILCWVFFFLLKPNYFFFTEGSKDSSWFIRIFMDVLIDCSFFSWEFSISSCALQKLDSFTTHVIHFWLGHCNCACSHSLTGCRILVGLWLSNTSFGRKLPAFLFGLIELYLFLPALFATEWCVPSAKITIPIKTQSEIRKQHNKFSIHDPNKKAQHHTLETPNPRIVLYILYFIYFCF